MEYGENSNLQSRGYCMPFEEREGRVELLKPYGEGNNGVDFKTHNYLLAAVADGKVVGAMNGRDGVSLIFQHGEYQLTYSGMKQRFAQIDQKVKAGMVVGVSGESLHIEVRYRDELINPMEFLTMIYGNIKILQQSGKLENPQFETIAMDVPTAYDEQQAEIEQLMYRFYPSYLEDLRSGAYLLPSRIEASLRNVFSWAAVKQFFGRVPRSLANPAGLDESAIPLAVKAQNLLIEDFLNYLAIRQQIFLSTIADEVKKKNTIGPY